MIKIKDFIANQNEHKIIQQMRKEFVVGAKIRFIKQHNFYYFKEYVGCEGIIVSVDIDRLRKYQVTVEMAIDSGLNRWGVDETTYECFEVIK